MAIAYAFKKLKKESGSLLSKLGLASDSRNMMGANFRTYGKELGCYDYDDFVELAQRIYREAQTNPGGFTVIDLPEGRKAIDFQGKMRGLYDFDGEPVAFYKPDFKALGFASPQEELEDFKAGVKTAMA